MAGCRKSRSRSNRSANRKNRSANRKASRKNRSVNRKDRQSRKNRRRSNMLGGAYNAMELSLNQGREFNEIHSRQHGGGVPLSGAPVGDQGLLPPELRDIARLSALDIKSQEIVGLHDPDQVAPGSAQAGGGRRRGRKSRRNNMGNSGLNQINAGLFTNAPAMNNGMNVDVMNNGMNARKNRKASRKNRKSSRKNRKSRSANRKSNGRNSMRRNTMMGGSYPGDGAPLSSPTMLLSASQAAKAGTGDFSNPLLRN